MSYANKQIGIIILVALIIGYLIYSYKCTEGFVQIKPFTFIGCFKDGGTMKQLNPFNTNRIPLKACEREAIRKGFNTYGIQNSKIEASSILGECMVGNINDATKLGHANRSNCYIGLSNTMLNRTMFDANGKKVSEYLNKPIFESNDIYGGPGTNAIYSRE